MGLVAIHTGHDMLLFRLLTEPQFRNRFDGNTQLPAVHALHDLNVLDPNIVNGLPRWNLNGQGWLYPMSHLIRADPESRYARGFPTTTSPAPPTATSTAAPCS